MDANKILLSKGGGTEMPFKEGTYEHESGFRIFVDENGTIMVSPNHPLSIRISEMFDANKWTKIS